MTRSCNRRDEEIEKLLAPVAQGAACEKGAYLLSRRIELLGAAPVNHGPGKLRIIFAVAGAEPYVMATMQSLEVAPM